MAITIVRPPSRPKRPKKGSATRATGVKKAKIHTIVTK